jgi:hypothetical protein
MLLRSRRLVAAPFLSHIADPGGHLSGDIRANKIILGIAVRGVFTVRGDIHKGEQVQRSYDNEGDGC